jgi:hypothetical protein
MTEREAIELAKANLDQETLSLIAHTSAHWVDKPGVDKEFLELFFSKHEKYRPLGEKLLEQPQPVFRGWLVKFVTVKKDKGTSKCSSAFFRICDSGKVVGTPFVEGLL